MMKNFFLICLIFISVNISVFSQNDALFSPSKSSKYSPKINTLLPAELVKLADFDLLSSQMLENFRLEHLKSNTLNFSVDFFPIDAQMYRKLINGYYPTDPSVINKCLELKSYFSNNPKVIKKLYNLLIPFYKSAFSEMSPTECKEFLQFLKAGVTYSDTLDMASESKEWETNKENFAYKKGKLNAFIFRRIQQKQLTKEECSKWMKQIYEDFAASANTSKKPSEDFIITKCLKDSIYEGTTFKSGNENLFLHESPTTWKPLVAENERIINPEFSSITYNSYSILLTKNTENIYSFYRIYPTYSKVDTGIDIVFCSRIKEHTYLIKNKNQEEFIFIIKHDYTRLIPWKSSNGLSFSEAFKNDTYILVSKNLEGSNHFGLMNTKGEMLLEPNHLSIEYNDALNFVLVNDPSLPIFKSLHALFHLETRTLSPYKYRFMPLFGEVKSSEEQWVYDEYGNMTLQTQPHYGFRVEQYENSVLLYSPKRSKEGNFSEANIHIVDFNGNPLLENSYPYLSYTQNGFFAVSKKGEYKEVLGEYGLYIELKSFDKLALYNSNTKVLSDFIYDAIESESFEYFDIYIGDSMIGHRTVILKEGEKFTLNDEGNLEPYAPYKQE